MRKIKKLLIANRGEIAVRIIKTCNELGIENIVIYSEQDKNALHVRFADKAYSLEGSKINETYLNVDKILDIAEKAGVDAIHPGYGFMSENPEFAEKCEEKDIIFIGPKSDAIKSMGLKTEARRIMKAADVPVIPGTEPLEKMEDVKKAAEEIGLPVIVKASAGGGGKGMRVVHDMKDLEPAFNSCKREATSSFGDPRVYIEKYIAEIHHVEFQIMADNYGNTVHLFERDCSIQRRHQKIIEETPSPVLNEDLRERMGQVAVQAAKACNYRNAGTVEFIVDGSKNFYFLEMNTRLQVEHPVTEMITGIDLVAKQIKIAEGENISGLKVGKRGHSIECRIYAEDPQNNFMPSPGKVNVFKRPSGFGVRNDSGVYPGYTIPMDYDPMISKLVVWGENRNQAIGRMIRALKDLKILGIKNNVDYLKNIIGHEKFKNNDINTEFIDEFEMTLTKINPDDVDWALAAVSILEFEKIVSKAKAKRCKKAKKSNWKLSGRLD